MSTNSVATTRPATAIGRRRRRVSMRRRERTRGAMGTSTALMSGLASRDADARVEHRVQEVDAEVDDDVRDRRDEDDPLDDRVVAREDRVERELPEARQHEDLLGDDRARDQEAELQAEDRHDRQQAVAQRVAADDLALAQPL